MSSFLCPMERVKNESGVGEGKEFFCRIPIQCAQMQADLANDGSIILAGPHLSETLPIS